MPAMKFYDYDDAERATLYRLFSSLFLGEPEEETILDMKEMFRMTFEETSREIGADFRHLFHEHGGHLRPFESLYNYPLGEKPALWSRVTGEVQDFYRSAGIMVDEEIDLAPDHLSIELLFMSYLVERGLTEEQKRFLNEHLLVWVPLFCDELRQHAVTGFYREVADLLREFLSSDYEELSE